ncbi:hypothetical protein Btru_026709 [Bulinus truncatus]|nr:hypothetical protein Btru_026709 [Bulinus truncatus]
MLNVLRLRHFSCEFNEMVGRILFVDTNKTLLFLETGIFAPVATQNLPMLVRFIVPLVSLQYLCTTCQGQCKDSGWFGPNCKYRCNCKDTKCRQDGECDNTTCRPGWFGNKCQYLNLFTESTTEPSKSKLRWLSDDIDNTCNDGQTKTLTIALKQEYPFTWLRLVLNDTANLSQMNISFALSNKTDSPCINQRLYLRNKTADLRCEQNILFRYINITGDFVLNLCSLYISGGRNVALKENTTQSTAYSDGVPLTFYDSSKAVDGNTNNDFNKKSCTHTKNETTPHWNITFSHHWIVSRFVLFNRNDNNPERLTRFILQTYDNENQLIDKYQDNQSSNQDYYQVINSINTPIKRVQITATHVNEKQEIFLTICEFEAYADCAPGKWGLDCLETCSNDCPRSCHPDNGVCETKCILQTDHPDCVQQDSSPIVGIAIGLGMCVSFVILDVVIYIKCRRYKALKLKESHLHRGGSSSTGAFKKLSNIFGRKESVESMLFFEIDDGESSDLNSQDKLGQKEESETSDTVQCTHSNVMCISTTGLNEYLQSRDREYFSRQFKSIPEPENVSTHVGLSEGNIAKNRYKNIITYDHSRVNLQVNLDNKEGDYINASYIKGYDEEVKFIASQAPTKTMINDFIRMIWEQKTDNIVMLTNLVEDGKVKCEQYWSNKGKTQFGNVKVRLCSTETFAGYRIRKLELSKKEEPCHKVTQFHFDSWPDKNVPLTPWGLVEFQNRVWTSRTSKPIVVHCSAGVGRTGTFIALCNVIEQGKETGRVNFFETLTKLRQDRMWMIQNVEQYMFLHQATQVALLCSSTYFDVNQTKNIVNSLREKTADGRTKLDLEYKTLCGVCKAVEKNTINPEDHSEYNPGNAEENIYSNSGRTTESRKDRFPDIIPKEIFRVPLYNDSRHADEYINAIFIQGPVSDNELIITQLPMPSTVVDFWRMIVQYKVTLVIAFEVDTFKTDKSVAEYLPSNTEQVVTCPPFRIHSAYMKKSDLWEERKLAVHKKLENHRLIHLQSTFTELNDRKLLSFIKQVKSYESTGRTVFMCRNGATYSGMACILSLLLDRIDSYTVSVPLTTGAVKSIRTQVISSVEEYKCLYDVLERYTDTSEQYHNVDEQLFRGNSQVQKTANDHRESQENNIYFNQ